MPRAGALVAGPLAACVLIGRSPGGMGGWRAHRVGVWRSQWRLRVLVVLATPLLCYWQVAAPLSNFASAASDPAVHASYYASLLGELRTLGVGYGSPPTRPARIEVVPTRNHWEARWVAPHVMLARGWERQFNINRDALFYDEAETPLTAARYRRWLFNETISYVALPDARLRTTGGGRGPVCCAVGTRGRWWRRAARRWRWGRATVPARNLALGALAPVRGAQPPAAGRGAPQHDRAQHRLVHRLSTPHGRLRRARAFHAYWAITDGRGCVRRAPGGWTEVQAHSAGSLHVAIDFSLQRMFDHGSRCS